MKSKLNFGEVKVFQKVGGRLVEKERFGEKKVISLNQMDKLQKEVKDFKGDRAKNYEDIKNETKNKLDNLFRKTG
jgi:hypothetical protein